MGNLNESNRASWFSIISHMKSTSTRCFCWCVISQAYTSRLAWILEGPVSGGIRTEGHLVTTKPSIRNSCPLVQWGIHTCIVQLWFHKRNHWHATNLETRNIIRGKNSKPRNDDLLCLSMLWKIALFTGTVHPCFILIYMGARCR